MQPDPIQPGSRDQPFDILSFVQTRTSLAPLDVPTLLKLDVSALFGLAQQYATRSNFAAKEFLYEQVIRIHPDASPIDIARLDIAAADRQRRAGKHDQALASLAGLNLSDSLAETDRMSFAIAHFEFYAAKSWALYYASIQKRDPELLLQSIATADEGARFCFEHSDTLPIEKVCQALEGALGVRVSSNTDLEGALKHAERYRSKVLEIEDPHLRTRGLSQYFAICGESLLRLNRPAEAIPVLLEYLELSESDLGSYYKIGAAIPYLTALLRCSHPDLTSSKTLGLAEFVANAVTNSSNTRDNYRAFLTEISTQFGNIKDALGPQ